MHDYSEDALIEQPAIALFGALGWGTVNCFGERFGPGGTLGRETPGEVVLVPRLRAALQRLNPDLPPTAVEAATAELARDRSAMGAAQANRDVYRLLKDGVKVRLRDEGDGEERVETVRVVDWNAPERNDFLLASQLWVAGDMYRRRCDLVGFVNGLPLVFVELKAAHRRLERAYRDNLRDYKDAIPQLFWYNAFVILSNGSQTRLGSMTAGWEHFFEWKKIGDEAERGVVSLETVIRGVCDRARLLDLVENFTLFADAPGGLVKIVAKNHQYLGVNNALAGVRAIRQNQGRLGVFWHTQGSGKSLSMVFFAQKVLRKIAGNWTFVVVTDRQELDDQIYKTFASAGAVAEKEVHAESGEQLRRLLGEDHCHVFTLIQKFRTEQPGDAFPTLSERADIVVITDEAHRSQYDRLALNMRRALPNAAFIAFTGTPLIVGEEKTRQVFGDYVSVYDFAQSIADGTTVPLYYENRIPELQLTNADLNTDIARIVEAAELDEDQERRLERELGREYHLIARDDRLERIAADLVAHYLGRSAVNGAANGAGKAMVVSIDKATAVRMYDKVRAHWRRELVRLRAELAAAPVAPEARATEDTGGKTYHVPRRGQGPAARRATRSAPPTPLRAPTGEGRRRLAERVAYMEHTDMAVVVSQAQNEIDDFRRKGLDIAPHRRRMLTEDLETRFKDPDDPLRIVFACAMWMTGFDVPSVTTIYLDKPMRNHTLMQTIARANRVFGDKTNGLIVDYVGVFRDLQQALAIYGSGQGGAATPGETPVRDKAELVAALRRAIAEAEGFLREQGIDPDAIRAVTGFARVGLLDDAVDALVAREETRKRFLDLAGNAERLYRSILPDAGAAEHTPGIALLAVLVRKIRALLPEADIAVVMGAIDRLLDASIASEGYVMPGVHEAGEGYAADRRIDLSQIDFERLRAEFERGRRHAQATKLRGQVSSALRRMVPLNRSRVDYLERFRRLIAEYNAGSMNVEVFFDKLLALARELKVEDQRATAEQLTEEELAVFDLLTRPEPDLSERERAQVKAVARRLLEKLKRDVLVLDWKKRQQTRAAVLTAIREVLDAELPRTYSPVVYGRKCDAVYQHVYDSYAGAGQSIYAQAS